MFKNSTQVCISYVFLFVVKTNRYFRFKLGILWGKPISSA